MRMNRETSTRIWLAMAATCCALSAFAPSAHAYCTVSHTDCNGAIGDEYISNVTIGTINNNSASIIGSCYSDFSSIATNIAPGNSLAISVTNGGDPTYFGSDLCRLWVDWDNSGVFADNANELVILANGGTAVFTGVVTCPPGTAPGLKRMRIRLRYSTTPTPCGTAAYGETEDYSINVAPSGSPTNPFVALSLGQSNGLIGTVFTATATVTPGTIPDSTGLAVSLDASQINGGTVTLYDDGTHGDTTIGDKVFTNNAVTVGAGATNGSKTLTATVTDAQSRSGTGNAAFTVGYCAAGSTTADEFISSVTTASISHTTAAWPTGGYSDLTAVSTVMFPNQSYSITVTNGPPNYAGDQCAVWIDWNHNGSFTDPGEAIAMTGSPGNGPYNGSILVPGDAVITTTTMRVRIAYNAAPLSCGSVTYGSTEDYSIVVQTAPPEGACCTGNACNIVPAGSCAGTYYGDGSCASPIAASRPAATTILVKN